MAATTTQAADLKIEVPEETVQTSWDEKQGEGKAAGQAEEAPEEPKEVNGERNSMNQGDGKPSKRRSLLELEEERNMRSSRLSAKSEETIPGKRSFKKLSFSGAFEYGLWHWKTLIKLSAFTAPGVPDYIDVVYWWIGCSLQSKVVLWFITLLLNWTVCIVLAGVGLLFALLYKNAFDWDEHPQVSMICGVIGAIFTGWNIAQYASYAIQTHGHMTIMQHLRAIRGIAPYLLPCNLIGWAMCFVVIYTPLVEWHVIFQLLIITVPPVVSGIYLKTHRKLAYFLAHSDNALSKREKKDGIAPRLNVEHLYLGSFPVCPFQKITPALTIFNFLGPFTCFVWTAVFVVAIRVGYLFAAGLDDTPKVVVQCSVFALSCLAVAAGLQLLNNWLIKSNGYEAYSPQMLVAFYVIYGGICDVQVRMGIVQMTGTTRFVCALAQPVCFAILRKLAMRGFKAEVGNRTATAPGRHEARLAIYCMASILTQNVSAVLMAGIPCVFEGNSLINVGTCPEGLMMQIFLDSWSTWASDLLGIAVAIRAGNPIIYFFSMLDPFLVIAAILVTFLNVMLALLTGSINF